MNFALAEDIYADAVEANRKIIMDAITEYSSKGYGRTCVSTKYFELDRNNIIKDLEDAGYKVSEDNHNIVIRWD